MKNPNLRAIWLLLALSLALPGAQRAKNVILFLADAGGIPTLNAASIQIYNDPAKLFVQHMPHLALSDTSSANNWVTDSAAGMTAIVTGHKTNNGVISQSADAIPLKKDGAPLKTILEYAEEHGLSTGVVSNSSMADATPAACYAHSNSRKQVGNIFSQVLKPRYGDGVDVIIGPGRDQMLAATREMGIDMLAELPKAGFYVADTLDGIPSGARRAVILNNNPNHDLAAATNAAIKILSANRKGFFLMVECDVHANRLPQAFERVATVDKIAADTVQRMSRDTLVLFTADHSFDLRLVGAPKGQPLFTGGDNRKGFVPKSMLINGHHSGEQVLVAAQGPGSERVHGFLANTDLFGIMLKAFGWRESK